MKKEIKLILVCFIFFNFDTLCKIFRNKMNKNKLMKKEINYIFKKYNKININDIDKKYYPSNQNIEKNIKNVINLFRK